MTTDSNVTPLVAILMGSRSDEEAMSGCGELLERFGIPYEQHVMSAHRTPDVVRDYSVSAKDAGIEVIVAGAGGAAALPGVIAAYTPLPVIGVPLASSELEGVDALHAIVQMPAGRAGRYDGGGHLGRAQRRRLRRAHPRAQPPGRLRRRSTPTARSRPGANPARSPPRTDD